MARTEAQVVSFEAGTMCSRCAASPLVKFVSTKLDLELPFCGHHGTKHEPVLLEQGFTIDVDLRHGDAAESDLATV